MSSRYTFPRPLSPREIEWLRFLLPADRPGYAPLLERALGLTVLGEGRWGSGDLVLGTPGQEIDPTEGMTTVASYGEVYVRTPDGPVTLTLSLHEPNDDGMMEFQTTALERDTIPDELIETRRWSVAEWLPGAPCPATGGGVVESVLNGVGDLRLVVSPERKVMWLYDAISGMNLLIPITNFYNELMLLKGIRDPNIALRHNLFFENPGAYSESELRASFVRYNAQFRKVDPARLELPVEERQRPASFLKRLAGAFRRES